MVAHKPEPREPATKIETRKVALAHYRAKWQMDDHSGASMDPAEAAV
jgi:hypothetical protein